MKDTLLRIIRRSAADRSSPAPLPRRRGAPRRLSEFLILHSVFAALALLATPARGDVILQYFECKWDWIEHRLPDIFSAGYDAFWLPPPGKADTGASSVGYDVFDRFDLGAGSDVTAYGTRNRLQSLVNESHRAGVLVYTDLVVNHNGFRDHRTPSFEEDGGYPGFAVKLSRENDPYGDFHNPNESDRYKQRISGLIDIAQEKNYQYIRHPVEEDDDNLPYKAIRPANRALYPDRELEPNEQDVYPFNRDDPMQGDPTLENATGVLLRHTQWMVDVIGVDGFRIDAAKHVPEWYFDDFHDKTVWQRGRPGFDGSPRTPFSFCEVYDGNFDLLGGYVRKDGFGDRDVLDFPLFFAMKDELSGTGYGSWKDIVDASIDGLDDNKYDGSVGVGFVSSHDNIGPVDDNLAYAFLLMRPGYPLVYFNAGQFGNRDFPKPGRGDALGDYGRIITTLVDIHHEYGREQFIKRVTGDDVCIFERREMCVVGLNDNGDTSQERYDEHTVQTAFPVGTRLHELTGNADDSKIDPDDDIPGVVVVDDNRRAMIRVPRNIDRRGYVIYGPANPDGELTVSPTDGEIAADGSNIPVKLRRTTPVPIITADSFDIRLETTPADPDDPDTDDNAIFRIDAGGDFNGNGEVDIATGEFEGYEQFTTERSPLYGGGDGLYRQTIDAALLDEGYHYLRVLAFRHRDEGGPIFETFSRPFYLDRAPPEVDLVVPTHTGRDDITRTFIVILARGLDRTTMRMHAILDRAISEDVLPLVSDRNKMTRDGGDFTFRWNNIVSGNHTIALVAFEDSGNYSVTKYKGINAHTSLGAGPGDCNRDGSVDFLDIDIFVDFLSQEHFDPTADINADGEVDFDDIDPFVECLIDGGCE